MILTLFLSLWVGLKFFTFGNLFKFKNLDINKTVGIFTLGALGIAISLVAFVAEVLEIKIFK